MSATISIAGRVIGDGHPVYIIAEAGANHNGDLALAKTLIDKAKECGADCIKFQTFSAEEFCLDRTKTFTYKSRGETVTESEFAMFKRLEFTSAEWAEIMDACRNTGIQFLTTIQDPVNLEMMLEHGLAGIKVGSDDFDHLINIRRYAKTGLPLILSKGMTDAREVDAVLSAIAPECDQLAVLHCVSIYPADARNLNLSQITTLRHQYPHIVWGFSDHSESTLAPAFAVATGARIIEKHFTLNHDLEGPDHWFSMDPAQFREMAVNIRYVEQALGSGVVALAPGEDASRKIMRRRIVAKTNMDAGAVLSEGDVAFKRAETGAFAGEWPMVVGKKLRVAKRINESISIKDIS